MNEQATKCNCCGQPIKSPNGRHLEDYLHIDKKWGYFSTRDLTKHSFNICEECYTKWIATFSIPIEESDVIEIFDLKDE